MARRTSGAAAVAIGRTWRQSFIEEGVDLLDDFLARFYSGAKLLALAAETSRGLRSLRGLSSTR